MNGLAPNHINIEFEQIVFNDIVSRMDDGASFVGNMFKQNAIPGFLDAQIEYKNWINSLTNNGTVYPVLGSISTFNADYLTYINNFKVYGEPKYTTTNVVPGMLPNALKELFNANLDCDN